MGWVSREKAEKLKPLQSYPDKDIPEPVYYNGPEIFNVAYVMDRLPQVQREYHPIEQDFETHLFDHSMTMRHHNYTNFNDYYEEWIKIKKKNEKGKKKKKKKKKSESEPSPLPEYFDVPGPPKQSKKQYIEELRLMGEKKSTITHEYALKNFNPMPKYTEADFDDDRHSLNRKLQYRLYLIVKDAATGKWKFPDGIRRNPDTLRSACERQVYRDHKLIDVHFFSNAPIAHYASPIVPLQKTYFFHCLYFGGKPSFTELKYKWEDHAWVTRYEIEEYDFVHENYKQVCLKMLPDGFVVL